MTVEQFLAGKEPLLTLVGDSRETLKEIPDESVHCCVTSPPYWAKRDYNHSDQIGLERTPKLFIEQLCGVFAEVRRVLRKDGTLWIVIGDTRIATNGESFSGRVKDQTSKQASNAQADMRLAPNRLAVRGYKAKDIVGTPFMLAFALRDAGWYWRQINIWFKPNGFSESVRDRTADSHEYILHLSKSAKYQYDGDAIKEPVSPLTLKRLEADWKGTDGRDYKGFPGAQDRNPAQINRELRAKMLKGEPILVNKRSVWKVGSIGYSGEHYATYPPALIKPMILAGTKPRDIVIDPFGGTGTTGQVAIELGRRAILCELNPAYVPLIKQRTNTTMGLPL